MMLAAAVARIRSIQRCFHLHPLQLHMRCAKQLIQTIGKLSLLQAVF